jgi:hypothetical protein
MITGEFERLLEVLTTRQHLSPHEPVAESLSRSIYLMDVCPNAIQQSIQWLQIDPSTSIGRLRRTELTQLARSIHRFWRQPAARQPQ